MMYTGWNEKLRKGARFCTNRSVVQEFSSNVAKVLERTNLM